MNNYLFVIGIDEYMSPHISNLNNAVADAKEIQQILIERYGFELFPDPLFNTQATKQNIHLGFTQLVATLHEDDNLIIYFSGHGRMHTLTSKGYWVPHDANDTTVDFIENSVIKDFIGAISAKHIFLIADSCFSGTFLSTTRGYLKETMYVELDTKKSRWMLASGGEETVSDGPKGQHSPFAKNLIDVLTLNTNKFISVEEIIRYVTALTAVSALQKPVGAHIENIGHEGGQLILTLAEEFKETDIDITKGRPHTDILLKNFRKVYKVKSNFSAGKDILIIESFVEEADLLIVELFRYDDNGKKKILFKDDNAVFKDSNNDEVKWKVIQRFATFDGASKFLEQNKHQFENKKTVIIGADIEIEKVEETEKVIEHKEFLQDLYDMNVSPMKCLHCSNMITTNDSYLVEIDEEGLVNNIGNVHSSCLRPLDRIVGKALYPEIAESSLIDFDYQTWGDLLKKGQGLITGAKKTTKQYEEVVIAWNRQHNFNTGEYCIKIILEDGSFTYMRLGKEIHRFTANEIKDELIVLNKSIDQYKGDEAQACTSIKKIFGIVSELKKIKSENETILSIVKYEKARYSDQLDISKAIENDYSPLGIVINAETKQIVNFGNCIPLISDPSTFDDFHSNWNKAGYTLGKCTLRIIDSDKDFDLNVINWFGNDMQPIIDPLFDTEQELISGIFIQDIEALINNKQQFLHSGSLIENPKWKAGARVRAVFLKASKDKFPEGTLMTDEFEDEDGEKRVIFCPIVDGILRDDLALSVPSKFIQKI